MSEFHGHGLRFSPAAGVIRILQPDLQRYPYVTLRHGQAPWRGQWVIRTDLGGTFWALHDREGGVGASNLIERYSFGQSLDASRFVRHLLRDGWSVSLCADAEVHHG